MFLAREPGFGEFMFVCERRTDGAVSERHEGNFVSTQVRYEIDGAGERTKTAVPAIAENERAIHIQHKALHAPQARGEWVALSHARQCRCYGPSASRGSSAFRPRSARHRASALV